MATSLDRNDHKEQPRAHSRKGHGSTTGSWFRWLQHTLLFFAIPLMTLLAGPAAYNRLAAREASHPVAESQLLEIAVLMDDIYSTFERMTYLPHAAITRGPHQINTTDVPCKRDPSVLRLMELMPYVNAADLVEPLNHQKAFWIHVSQFVDYRRAYMREENCDPFNVGYDDGPTTLMLSGLNDRTYSPSFEILYDTKYNSIRVWDGIRFLSIHDTEMPRAKHDDDSSVALFHHSIKSILAIVCRKDGVDRKTWFHAPKFLARIRDTYQSLDWTPWETSKPDGYGVSDATIKSLLRQNGWPDSFNPDQFNADFIRAKHAPSPYGPAQSAHDIVEALETSDGKGRYHDDTIKGIQERVQKFERKIKEAEDYQDRWAHTITLQIARWRLDASHTRLAAAKADIARLCPNATCIDPADMILWEFHNLEKAYLTAQRGASIEAACENEQYDTQHYAPPSPKRMITCHSRRRREAKWWERAYTQSRAAALARCAQTGASLIPQPTFDQVAAEKIAELEAEIADSHARAALMDAYFPNIPEDAERARMLFEMEHSAAVNGPWYARDRIEWVREQLGGDEEGRRRMWRCFDNEECW